MNIRTWMCNREILSEKLAQGYTAKPLWKIFFGVLLLLNLAFLAITIMKGLNDTESGSSLNTHLEYSEFSFSRLQTFTETLQFLNTMVLVNMKIVTPRNKTKAQVLNHLMKSLVYTLNETYIGINQLHDLRRVDLKGETKDHLEKPITAHMLPNNKKLEYFKLSTASHMYYRLFQRVTEYDPKLVLPIDPIILSIYGNGFYIYYMYSISANDFLEELFSSVAYYSDSLDFYIYMISICSACSIVIIVILVVIIQRDRLKSLSCFLSISSRKLEKHSKSIENFIIFMKNRNGMEVEVETGGDNDRGEIQKVILKKEVHPNTRINTNKQYSYSLTSTCCKIMRFIILYLLFECYFVVLHTVQKKWSNKLKLIKAEYNSTGQASVFYGMSFISLMIGAMALDNGLWKNAVLVYMSDENLHLNSLTVNHMLYGKDFSSSYNSIFSEVTEGNICKYMSSPIGTFITRDECETNFKGTFKQGLFAALTYYKDFVCYATRKYAKLNMTDANALKARSYFEELNREEAYYFPFLFPELIRPAVNAIRKSFKNSLNDYIVNLMKIQNIVLIIFIAGIIMFQALYGISAYFENQWLKKISLSVTIIPPSMTVNNKAMVDFVKESIGKSYEH